MQDNRKAIIVGASSGIGRELAMLLSRDGYILGLVARHSKPLYTLHHVLPSHSYVKVIDIRNVEETRACLRDLIATLGTLDLVIISAGIGPLNQALELNKELDTIATNVTGFTTVANVALHYFMQQGRGHLVGISSIAGLRGNAVAPAYNASKSFVSNYLEGVMQKMTKARLAISITDVQPGYINTAMAKGEGLFWVTPVRSAAEQIYRAIRHKQHHVYISRRWWLIAQVLRWLPDWIYRRL